MYNPKCCGKKMLKQEIYYGQNWTCEVCGKSKKTPANGMTKSDINDFYKNRAKLAKTLPGE